MTSGDYRYLFGPVRSRRLGLSLGIDLVPSKICSFNCPYCQIGPTTTQTLERREYVPGRAVLEEFDRWLAEGGRADCVTLAGSGEPTLHTGFGDVLRGVAERCRLRRVLLSNGTLFGQPSVRDAAARADVVKGTLSAWDQASFEAVHRPHASLRFDAFVQGLGAMRAGFKGEYWLEVFLLPGINDHPEAVRRIAALAKRIAPDRIHLNTAIRPAADASVSAVASERLLELAGLFTPVADVAAGGRPGSGPAGDSLSEGVAARLCASAERHPATAADMAAALGLDLGAVDSMLDTLVREGRLRVEMRRGTPYYLKGT